MFRLRSNKKHESRFFAESALSGKERCFAEFILSAVEGLSMTEIEGLRRLAIQFVILNEVKDLSENATTSKQSAMKGDSNAV
jgi:hypothetical protein